MGGSAAKEMEAAAMGTTEQKMEWRFLVKESLMRNVDSLGILQRSDLQSRYKTTGSAFKGFVSTKMDDARQAFRINVSGHGDVIQLSEDGVDDNKALAHEASGSLASMTAKASSGKEIKVLHRPPKVGDEVYTDKKNATFVNMGDFAGEDVSYLQVPNQDNTTDASSTMWTIQVPMPVIVFLDFWGGEAQTSLVQDYWLSSWTKTSKLGCTWGQGQDRVGGAGGVVYKKAFEQGSIQIPGAGSHDGQMGCFYAFVKKGGAGTTLNFKLPESNAFVWGPAAKFVIRVFSADLPNLRPIVKHCDNEDVVTAICLDLLRAGADTLCISIGREMMGLEFDKTQVVEENEYIQRMETSDLSKTWVITGFTWTTMLHCKMVPAADPLQRQFDRLAEGKTTKAQLVREMKRIGAPQYPQDEIVRFVEAVADTDSGLGMTKTREYYSYRAAKAHELQFCLKMVEDLEQLDPDADDGAHREPKDDGPQKEDYKSVRDCIGHMTQDLRGLAQEVNAWVPLMLWEPLRITTVKESMHMARQALSNGDEDGYLRYSLRAVDFVAKVGAAGGMGSALSSTERDEVLATSKRMTDRLVDRYMSGTIHDDKFLEAFTIACDRMLGIVEVLIAVSRDADELQNVVLYLRTKADYMRYLHVWVPNRRQQEAEIMSIYKQALEVGQHLPARNLTTLTSWVNLALYHVEVCRDPNQGSKTLRRGIAAESKRKLNRQPAPAETFTWHLMTLNLECFESRIVVFKVRFNAELLAAQTEAAQLAGDADPEMAKPSSWAITTTRRVTAAGGAIAEEGEELEDSGPVGLQKYTADLRNCDTSAILKPGATCTSGYPTGASKRPRS
jgi:hypothetical protein